MRIEEEPRMCGALLLFRLWENAGELAGNWKLDSKVLNLVLFY